MVPKQAQFQMLDGKTSNGTGDLQINFIQACNSEMSVAILGNTETTTSSKSSGYAQAKEQANQQLEITKTDLAFVENVLNGKKFLKILQSYGFPADRGAFQFSKELDTEELQKQLNIDRELSQHVPLSDDYWYEKYGRPKPDNYEELKAQKIAEVEAAREAMKKNQNSENGEQAADGDATDKKNSKNLIDWLSGFFVKAPKGSGADLEF
jgi:phage gp29-like protein